MKSCIMVAGEPGFKPLGLDGDLEKNAALLAELGFEGMELAAMDMNQLPTGRIRQISESYHLPIAAVAAGRYYTQHGLSLSAGDSTVRKKTIENVKESIKIAAEINTSLIIGLSQGKVEKSYRESFDHLKYSLQDCVEYAAEMEVILLLEPINRYLPALIQTLGEGVRMIREVASPWLRLLADTHHMNIEERSMEESLKQTRGYLGHIHFSDSNRLAPGQGHIDFYKVVEVLREIGYDGFASAEIVSEPDNATAAKLSIEMMRALRL